MCTENTFSEPHAHLIPTLAGFIDVKIVINVELCPLQVRRTLHAGAHASNSDLCFLGVKRTARESRHLEVK
jgi:hypothetical protein